ncbi:restriction endonuclease subunit S [uncultured Bartonella sp.]|uniref:restriction endonuclease subunit S n=1 Tax=uncultured Bartonella sp. TaxID=104108 RepID=UPI0025FD40E2|nr:restriction endonuclease subunit S [uncultured Bartonella sp.]
MSKFPFVSIESIANKVAMGPFGSSIKVETFTSEGIPIISGAHLHNVKLTDGNYNFISPAHASNLKNSIVHKKDIIFTHAGNIGQVSYIPDNSKYKNYIISQRQFYLRCNERALPEYVAYYFKSRKGKFSLLANSSQVGVPSIAQPVSYLKSIKIPLPEKKVQLAIVNILCSFDDKIELNRKMNETLEEMAQAVFQDWFVDFGPVKRKAKGITDPVAILGGLIPNPAQAQKIASLFPDQFAEDGLPRGWDLKPLTNLASIISGGTPKTSESKYWNGDIPWYSIVDAPKSGEVFVLDTQKHITIEGLNNSAARLIRPNVTIISARGTVGKLAIADHAMCFNQSCYGIEANNCINDYFIYLNLIHALNRLQNMAYGTVFSTITRKTIEKIFINIPSNDLLISFSTCVDPLFNLIKHNGEQIRTLAEMRDLLLPKLMSGEISVDELEKKMGGVL